MNFEYAISILRKIVAAVKKLLCWTVVVCLPVLSWAESGHVDIARFSQGDLKGWQTKVFSGKTSYALRKEDGRTVLHADSRATASGLYRETSIDLRRTPILSWIWKVDNILTGNDERTKTGDDYPARIYVVFSGGALFWRTRAINYVWSNNQSVGSNWLNAFTSNAGMIAVESGVSRTGQWIQINRDVLADYRKIFGEEPGTVDAVAIMTDTDNTGASATAWYGDIWFAAK